MINRRQFLKHSALVSVTPLVPAFLQQTVRAADARFDDRILVVVQLDGGNDGLNTIVPLKDELYPKLRPTLHIRSDDALKINEEIGFHPGMKAAAELLEEDRLSILQGVGYPNPNRSHFESMAIWQHARLDSSAHDSIGWLGRSMDARPSSETDAIFIGEGATPVALRGRRSQAASMASQSDLELAIPMPSVTGAPQTDSLAAFVTRSLDDSFRTAKRFSESSLPSADGAAYPRSKLAGQLKLISRLIKLDGATRVFYVSQPGYDTHASQSFQHRQLLSTLSGALNAFAEDMKASGLAERVLTMCFSEFGRRVAENGSAGTDHGAAGPIFLVGNSVKAGLVGAHPSLADLDQGDLKHALDFRSLYASLLERWLGIEASEILQGEFEPIDCLS